MNKKNIIILSVLMVIIFTILGVVYYYTKPKSNLASGYISMPINEKENITIKDFISNAEAVYENSVVLYFDSYYSIMYEKKLGYFEIIFSSTNKDELKKLRPYAEKMFIYKLGLKETDACKLRVKETIKETEGLSLQNYVYPLSFCDSSINFPN